VRNVAYKPPFVYFGGKSPVAHLVWEALGNPYNYVEPFCGSAAVLFLRDQPGDVETINDADGFIANAWRAIQLNPEGVAEHADNPVSECDLHARHLWLIGQRESLTNKLCGDPDYFDLKAAGWWIWGANVWIGSGWCSGRGPWTSEGGEMVLRNPGQGVNRQLPHLGDPGKGGDTATPTLGRPGEGRQPETPECDARREWLVEYLGWFADRLRNVRVCCGDWSRVCGPSVTHRHGPTGVFLDPPYADSAGRTSDLYAVDCQHVSHAVREWAIEQGTNPLMRIVLAGYDSEHEMPNDWRVVEWKATGGYGLQGDEESGGRLNRGRERLWCSPHCLRPSQGSLFTEDVA
jgi:DNA adenine methylase